MSLFTGRFKAEEQKMESISMTPEVAITHLDQLSKSTEIESHFGLDAILLQSAITDIKPYLEKSLGYNLAQRFDLSKDKHEYCLYDPKSKTVTMFFDGTETTYGYMSGKFDKSDQSHFGIVIKKGNDVQAIAFDTLDNKKWQYKNTREKTRKPRQGQTWAEWLDERIY